MYDWNQKQGEHNVFLESNTMKTEYISGIKHKKKLNGANHKT